MRVRYALAALLSALWLSPLVAAADVRVLFDANDPNKTIFPSNLFTKLDFTQLTFRRVDLPKPARCSTTPVPVSCTDIDVLNELDGFNPQPRISVPFSGPIDPATVTSDTLFLLSLGSVTGGGSFGEKVGINQIVWDPATNTLHVESDQLLDPHTRYAVIVTNGILDTAGEPIEGGAFDRFRHDLNFGQTKDSDLKDYRHDLIDAFEQGGRAHQKRVVAASVFTTLSTTAVMEKIRRQVHGATPAPATFNIGNGGTVRAVFPLNTVTSVLVTRQVGTAPTFGPPTPVLAFGALQLVPGSVGQVAFGKYSSPNYLDTVQSIPTVPTRTGHPVIQSMNDIYFNLIVPSSPKPAGGWPIAIFGHGFGDSKDNSPFVVASTLAAQGIATIAIDVVGHGRGPLSTLTVNRSAANGGPVTFLAGGRGIDQDGNGTIDSTEGSNTAAPRTLLGSTDALRQTDVDLMQLVRVIESGGIDVDGDGDGDFNPARIYYFGQSFGGIYGTMFLAIEPDVRVGVPNVAGGPTIEIIRLSPVFRALFNGAAAVRGLANAPSPVVVNENFPLRNEPPRINNVAGAMEIQRFMDNSEWAGHVGNPVSYAPHLRKNPLDDVPAKTLIFQNAKGDQTVPNPTNTAIIRAGDLADRWTFYRNDLARAANPATPANPHTFLTNINGGGLAPTVAVGAQTQIATFFASDGALIIDPDGAGPLFEVPIVPPLPEVTNF